MALVYAILIAMNMMSAPSATTTQSGISTGTTAPSGIPIVDAGEQN